MPKANIVVGLKNPMIALTAESTVKTRIFSDLVRDALEEYSYDAELAGLEYNLEIDARGLFIDVSGYNDKLPAFLEQVLIKMRDLEIAEDRFQIVMEQAARSYRNWVFQQPYHQLSDYSSLLSSEVEFLVDDMSAELSSITLEGARNFQKAGPVADVPRSPTCTEICTRRMR